MYHLCCEVRQQNRLPVPLPLETTRWLRPDPCRLASGHHFRCLVLYCQTRILTLSPLNKLLSAKFIFCFNIQSASISLKAGEMLSKCQTAWIWMRRRVTRRLIRVQAVCIWDYSRAWRSKG